MKGTLGGLLEEAVPIREPGRACAEHALTYGHLCDELVRLATGEDLASRFARLAADHGWDVHPRVDEHEIGMGGAGGSSGWWSFAGRYAAAFVSRGLGSHDRGERVYELLEAR